MNLLLIAGILLLMAVAYLIWREFTPGKPELRGFWQKPKKQDVKRMLEERLFLPKEVGTGRKKIPISGKCYKCGKRAIMPYKCKFCGGLYCDNHRLPESHDCEGLKRLKRDMNK